MALKDDLIKQLNDMGKQLGRTISTDGSVEDLKLRVREVQEELDALSDDGDGNEDSNEGDGGQGAGAGESTNDTPKPPVEDREKVVLVRALRTLHVKGQDPKTRRMVRVVVQDSVVLVASTDLQALKGLVREV
ncbi:DNA-packaging protein FI [Cedecea neteri]|uniref:DNA-packaging protein FI n=1 Tax=Cedecea neteri TaxID=158822 RepID=UPI00068DC146|nr:DNA-packaging protein FI [Cedecea neteri]